MRPFAKLLSTWTLVIGPPNGPVLFVSLASIVYRRRLSSSSSEVILGIARSIEKHWEFLRRCMQQDGLFKPQ